MGLSGWHVLIILGILIVTAAVIVGIGLTIVVLARRTAPGGTGGQPGTDGSAGDPVEQIRRLAELRDQGLLTEDEFQAKRTELLGRI